MKKTVGIVYYGLGNISSICNALSFLGFSSIVSSKKEELEHVDTLILPGVGAFDLAMQRIDDLGIRKVLDYLVIKKGIPILGICLGMQILANTSEEGASQNPEKTSNKGLGWIPADVVRIKQSPSEPIPHVGWNTITLERTSPLFQNISNNNHFFFDHSYRFTCDPSYVLATTHYSETIIAAVANKHIYGVQFHPEKSQTVGLRLLKNFISRMDF